MAPIWWAQQDSNLRSPACRTGVLVARRCARFVSPSFSVLGIRQIISLDPFPNCGIAHAQLCSDGRKRLVFYKIFEHFGRGSNRLSLGQLTAIIATILLASPSHKLLTTIRANTWYHISRPRLLVCLGPQYSFFCDAGFVWMLLSMAILA